MPVLPSPDSASRFGERRLDPAAGSGSVPLDDSLTSLHWLQNFSILSADPERLAGTGPDSPSSQHHLLLRRLGFPRTGTESPSSPPAGDTAAAAGTPRYPGSSQTSAAPPRFCPVQTGPQLELDYRNNPTVKPPFSYASLICMAMQASRRPKVPLATIYSWITDNFCYYRHAEPSWQNSIRHNLSLNKCFKKVPRQKDEPGKGGFWQIDPQYADMFVNGIFKRRRMSANQYGGGGAAARPSKLAEGVPSSWPHQAGARRKQLPSTGRSKLLRSTQSPLLAVEATEPDVLKGDFDLGSVFDEVLGGGCSTFEDLDLNTALSSLGCEVEACMSGRHQAAGLGRWGGSADVTHYPSCSYLDLEQDQLLQGQQQLQQLDGSATLFGEPAAALQPWEEVKEEPQVIPLTLDPGFGLYEGFFTEMQQWERVDNYL